MHPDVIRFEIDFQFFDLSLENRRKTKNQVVYEAAEAMKKAGFGLKAATITPEEKGDVGSPTPSCAGNRRQGDRPHRTADSRSAPGAGTYAPISVIRMAVGDAYGAEEWREGEGMEETAFRTERIDRKTCRAVAEFAFQHAKRMNAKVFGGPKFTVSPVYEGMLKEEMDAASKRHPEVPYEPQLIDATYALLLNNSGEPMVIPALNRDGDCLSDLVLQLFGSIAGAESILLSFDEDFSPKVVMAEAPHGTAPTLFGKNIANPMAMILAAASLLTYFNDPRASTASRAIYESTIEAVREGTRTADLGGSSTTTEFTDEVIRKVQTKLEVWSTLQGY